MFEFNLKLLCNELHRRIVGQAKNISVHCTHDDEYKTREISSLFTGRVIFSAFSAYFFHDTSANIDVFLIIT